jgi:hypothetical protein
MRFNQFLASLLIIYLGLSPLRIILGELGPICSLGADLPAVEGVHIQLCEVHTGTENLKGLVRLLLSPPFLFLVDLYTFYFFALVPSTLVESSV